MTAVASLRVGDRVAVINGVTLPEPLAVGDVEARKARLIPARPSSVEWWIYEDQHTVELAVAAAPEPPVTAPEPAPKPRRVVSKTIEGVRLFSAGGGTWASADGEYRVQLESGVTTCEADHPVRITHQLAEWARENSHRDIARPVLTAIAFGRKGFICEGDQEHSYPIWTVWAKGQPVDDMGDTFAEALQILAAAICKGRRV